ncbi:MAG: carboxypeptidase regulatory-like domain-containing protein [Bryobacteraceae bacterium]
MSGGQKAALITATAILLGIVAGVLITVRSRPIQTEILVGVVLARDADPRKQMPIAGAEITASSGLAGGECRSDSTGFFRLTLHPGVTPGQPVTLTFRHPDYQPLDTTEAAEDSIYLAHMVPISNETQVKANGPEVAIADVRVRYSVKTTTTENIGSLAKTFEVVNANGVPCYGRPPCSSDGKWKASLGSISIDAGAGNEFSDMRISCIAGPCPFTKIEPNNSPQSGRIARVSARNWSATATFLVEAQVVHTTVSDMIRQSYPVIFGPSMNFTLPATAVGPSIEAALNGTDIVFPLGPALMLSWGVCSVKIDSDRSRLIRCELKPGYRFRDAKM